MKNRYLVMAVVLATVIGAVGFSMPAVAAGSVGSTVPFNGRVMDTAVPTCSYDAASLSVSVAPIDFDKVLLASAGTSALASVGLAPGGIVANGQAVRDMVAGGFAVNGGYGSGRVNISCKNLSAPFVVRTKSGPNDPPTNECSAVGCAYLKINPGTADATMAANLALAIFVFAPLPGQRTIGAGWVDPSRNFGFATGGLSSGGGYPMLNAAETADSELAKNLELGFLLVKVVDLAAWANSKDTSVQPYTSSIQMSLVYQ